MKVNYTNHSNKYKRPPIMDCFSFLGCKDVNTDAELLAVRCEVWVMKDKLIESC